MPPVELHATTNLSFLRGAFAPEELIAAEALGHRALGITDPPPPPCPPPMSPPALPASV